MFRAARCSSSGGPIVSPQPLVSSPSVSSRTVRRWRADFFRSPPAYCTAVCEEWRYQRLWWYNWSSWWWAACCSKHVEECNVTYIYCWRLNELCTKLVFWKVFQIAAHGLNQMCDLIPRQRVWKWRKYYRKGWRNKTKIWCLFSTHVLH